MSNRLYQNIVSKMHDAIDRVIGVVDKSDIVVACSDDSAVGESRFGFRDCFTGDNTYCTFGGYTYILVEGSGAEECAVFVAGEDETALSHARLIGISLSNIKELYDEKYDKNSFIKNIMMDNILPSDIYVKSKEMNLDTEARFIVMIIKFSGYSEIVPLEIVSGMFPQNDGNYIVSVGESDVVLVKRVEDTHPEISEFEALAGSIVESISTEFFAKTSIGVSSVVSNIRELAKAYKEARVALEVGKVFDIEKDVLCYENLGIGRLIYQLPTTLCDVFLQEVFKKGSLESLDPDTLMTVQAFFKNNLNVSETSRALFVHRNTLVYRLEKIHKITGLDLRRFDHAVTFKVALMVKKYLTNKPMKF